MAFSKSNTASNVKPNKRKGNKINQTMGYKIRAINLETAIDRCFLQNDVDFIEKIGEKTVTHLVRALQAQLLVSRLPSVVAPPSSMEAASVKWGFQTTPLSAHVTDCPYLDNLLPLRLAGKPVNCLLGLVQPPFLGLRPMASTARIKSTTK